MILKAISLKNWKNITQAEIYFKKGINNLYGKNYAGKTSIFQALYYGLFNEVRGNGVSPDDMKKENTNHTSVELDFSVNGDKFRITRNMSGTKAIRHDSHLYKMSDNFEKKLEELDAFSRKDDELSHLKKIYRTDEDFMKEISFIDKNHIIKFIENPPSELRDQINYYMGLDDLIKITDVLRGAERAAQADLSEIEDQQDKYQELKENLSENIDNLEQRLEDIKEKLKKKNHRVSEKKVLLKNRNASSAALQTQLERTKKDVKRKKSDKEEASQEINELRSELKEIEEEKNRLSELQQNEKKWKDLKAQKKKHEAKLNSIRGDLRDISRTRDQFQDIISKVEKKKKLLLKLEGIQTKVRRRKEKIEAMDKKKKKMEQSGKKVEKLAKKEDKFDLNAKYIRKKICPACESKDVKCPIAEEVATKIQEKLKKIRGNEEKIEKYKERKRNFNKQYDKLNDIVYKNRDIYEKIEELQEDLTKYKQRKNELQSDIEAEYSIQEEKRQIKEKISEKEKEIKELSQAHDELIVLRQKIERKDKLKEKLSKKHEKSKRLTKNLEELQDEIQKISKELEDKEIEGNEIDADTLEKDINDLQAQIEKLTRLRSKNKGKLEDLRSRLKKALSPYESPEKLERALLDQAHLAYKVRFMRLSSEKTIKEMEHRILQKIKNQCNELWKKFKKGAILDRIDWDENFMPFVSKEKTRRKLFLLSNSEKMFVFLIIRAILQSNIESDKFFVIDDLLEPFDGENKGLVTEILSEIIESGKVKQIITTGFEPTPSKKCHNIALNS